GDGHSCVWSQWSNRRADRDSGQRRRPHVSVRRRSGLHGRLRQEASWGQLPLEGKRTVDLEGASGSGGRLRGRPQHAAEPGAVGQHVQVSSGSSRVDYTMAKTKGVFGDKSYEITPIKDRLHLEAGAQSIALSIPDAPKAMDVLNF